MNEWRRWVSWPEGTEAIDSDALAPGFLAGAASAGIKGNGLLDVGLVRAEPGCEVASALALTSNAAAAAPVEVSRENCDSGRIAAAVVNSGNANAATGEQGRSDAEAMQRTAAQTCDLDAEQVAVAQTGVIGVPLELEPLLAAIGKAGDDLSSGGADSLARAMMTTDKGPKQVAVRCEGVTLTAQAKGAGMIQPGFATMLCFVQTDAVGDDLESVARSAISESFERISVDGQMSTNDTVLVQASGLSGKPLPAGLLEAAMLELALEIVGDGEGATRVCRVEVTGASDEVEAERVVRAVANSALVKTALGGSDPNWGRILQAVGAELAGADLDGFGPDSIDAEEMGSDRPDPEISVELSRGSAHSYAYFSDLTKRYVEINAEYTT